jgi:hypothetical protein
MFIFLSVHGRSRGFCWIGLDFLKRRSRLSGLNIQQSVNGLGHFRWKRTRNSRHDALVRQLLLLSDKTQ